MGSINNSETDINTWDIEAGDFGSIRNGVLTLINVGMAPDPETGKETYVTVSIPLGKLTPDQQANAIMYSLADAFKHTASPAKGYHEKSDSCMALYAAWAQGMSRKNKGRGSDPILNEMHSIALSEIRAQLSMRGIQPTDKRATKARNKHLEKNEARIRALALANIEASRDAEDMDDLFEV